MRKHGVGAASLLLLFCQATAASPPARVDPDGVRREPAPRPFVCGSGPGLAEAMARRHRAALEAMPNVPESAADRDQGQIAILFDQGNLVVSGYTDTTAIAQQFYLTHPDDFDYLAIFMSSAYNFDVQIESGFAFHRRVASDVLGVGIDPIDRTAELGLGTTRLRSLLQLNDLLEYLPRYDDPLPQFGTEVEGVEILGQEAGHQFLSFAEVAGEGMLGRDGSHWSFFMNTDGSVMEGNAWVQVGNDFVSGPAFETYSQLDEYLMGLRAASAVSAPIFVIQQPKRAHDYAADSLPEAGVEIGGNRRDLSVAEIIGAVGARVPDAATAPHVFTMAFALVVPDGMQPPPGDLDLLEGYRRTWVDWFAKETEDLGHIDTALPGVDVSADFVVETFAGPAPLEVRFRDRSRGPVTSYLWDFGDGTTSAEVDPAHVYGQPGFFTVTLTVDGPGGPAVASRRHRVAVGSFVERAREDFEGEGPTTWGPTSPSTATSGQWVLGDPVGSSRVGLPVQPEDDATEDPGTQCWVTGNADPGAPVGANDVDNGVVSLLSPAYDLTGTVMPVLDYQLWLSNRLGGEPGTDLWKVDVSPDDGATWFPLDETRLDDRVWRNRQALVSDVVVPSAHTRFRFQVGDLGLGSLVEAGLDDVRILSLPGQADADHDGTPDVIDDCPGVQAAGQDDADGDGFGAPCDCDDLDPAVEGLPGASLRVTLDPGAPHTIRWTADPIADAYQVYRGLSASPPFAYNHIKLLGGHTTGLETADELDPALGAWSYYLVAAINDCGEAGLGFASDGTVRPGAVLPAP